LILIKTDEDIASLFRKYEPLKNVDVKLRPPVEYENKAIYYGEW
jgi:hypothetical protein